MSEMVVDCPLCGESVPRKKLKDHVLVERREIQSLIVSSIKRSHPEWVEDDGACPKCWDQFKKS